MAPIAQNKKVSFSLPEVFLLLLRASAQREDWGAKGKYVLKVVVVRREEREIARCKQST